MAKNPTTQPPAGAGTPPPASDKTERSPEELLQENAALRAKLAKLEGDTEQNSKRAAMIKAKMAAGLSRSQAEQVVAAQEAHDKALAEAAKK
jgi:hypothetical protein